ncbi:MAG: anaerobic sulfatase maturase [Armatimonadota bacterium]|jgi:uncharacterized protein
MARNTPEPYLSLLVKPAGPDCNLDCSYCFYRCKADLYPETRKHRMSLEVLERFIADYLRMPFPQASFGWQGGEPTLMGLDFFRHAVELQRKCAAPGQVITNGLQTNAMLIDEEWARFCAEENFLTGVSLDGPADIHDYYRLTLGGKPSWQRVMDSIEALKEAGAEFNILCMATPQSAAEPERVYDFFMEHGLHFLQFIPCVERDPRTGDIADHTVRPHDYGRLLCRIFDRWIAGDWQHVYIRMFNDMLMAYRVGTQPTCILQPTCHGAIVVEHNGDCYACDFFVEPEWYLGNVMETTLRKMSAGATMARFRERKQELAEKCRKCNYLWLCHGSCVKERLVVGSADSPSYLCEGLKAFFAHSEPGFRALSRQIEAEERMQMQMEGADVADPRPNDPCPCGSGKKYKRCCQRRQRATA